MGTQYNNNRNGYRNKNIDRNINTDFYNPYTFVPLNNRVYLLSEQETKMLDAVQDIPFKDALSGKIKVDFVTKSPICVRGNDTKSANVDGEYFIPATSIKGMIRNVFEIITMGNIRNSVANNRYSMRDLRNNAYELKSTDKPQSGFLLQIGNRFYIKECKSEPWTYDEIEKEEGVYGLKNGRTIQEKYAKLRNPIVGYEDGSYTMWFFSGFMNNKRHEFLFDIPTNFNKSHQIEDDVYQDFIFIHEKENENANWKYWKKKLKNYKSVDEIFADRFKGIVPCFFRINKDNSVKDLGFSYLYRQPYKRKIHDFLPEEYKQDGIDMAQSIFGFIKGSDTLKGRVQVGNSFIKDAKLEDERTYILGSPKPTYYPFYLEQKNRVYGQLNTYFSKDTVIAGYKRYLPQSSVSYCNIPKSRVTTSFIPLAPETKFSTYIYFHNLRDYELGALLAAITFCNNIDKCYHSLGFAKPYGYGKLKVEKLPSICLADNKHKIFEELYRAFVEKICKECQFKDEDDFRNSIATLFSIASGSYRIQKDIRYPKMDDKEFETIKKKKLSLTDFSPNIND